MRNNDTIINRFEQTKAKKPKRFVILSSDKSSERNLSSFFDINSQEDRAFTE